MKEPFIRFTANAFRKLLSVYVFTYFPFDSEGRVWDLIVSVPDHNLSFHFTTDTRYYSQAFLKITLKMFSNSYRVRGRGRCRGTR